MSASTSTQEAVVSSSVVGANAPSSSLSSSSATSSSDSTSGSDTVTLSSLYEKLEALIKAGRGQSTYGHLNAALKPHQTQQLTKAKDLIQRAKQIQLRQKEEEEAKMKDVGGRNSESKNNGDAHMSDDDDDDDDPIHWHQLLRIAAQVGNIPLLRVLLDANLCEYPGLADDAIFMSNDDCLRFILDYEEEHGLAESVDLHRDHTLTCALSHHRPLSTLQLLYEHGAKPTWEAYNDASQFGNVDQCRWLDECYDPDPGEWEWGIQQCIQYRKYSPLVEYLTTRIRQKEGQTQRESNGTGRDGE